ncbi:A/G-specific adenine glycosylase [soil metagenome]
MTSFADTIVDWYDANARDLPWRRAGTVPWAVLVSEVMLQQTPVGRVLPVWSAWLERWPIPAALAAATPGAAVRAWGKLGYPRRALRLHETAGLLVSRHGGLVPADVADLLALPGIGGYTARAVASFAFGQRHAVVDTNVRRLTARALTGLALPGRPSESVDRAVLEPVLPTDPGRAARFAAAAMELGATVCTARAPRCEDCPVHRRCAWQLAGRPPYDGPARTTAGFVGTDRQVRGLLLDVLRASPDPVPTQELTSVWTDSVRRERALAGLIADGLMVPVAGGRYALPG